MSQLTNLAQEQFTELFNLINAICNTHNAKIRMAWSNEDLYCINVDADNIDTIVDMNFELADKITSNELLENLDFIVKFEPYQPQLKTGENEMKQEKIVLDGDTVIKGVSLTKPMTGDVVAVIKRPLRPLMN